MAARTSTLDGRPRRVRPARVLPVALGVAAVGATAAFLIARSVSSDEPAPTPPIAVSPAVRSSVPDAAAMPTPDAATEVAIEPSAIGAQITDDTAADGKGKISDATFGYVEVRAFPVLTVWIDGKSYGDTPKRVRLSVGKHALRLFNRDTGHDERVPLEIHAGKTTPIERTK